MSVIRLDAIANELCDKIISDTSSTPIEANGSPLDVVGQIVIPDAIGSSCTEQAFVVVNKIGC